MAERPASGQAAPAGYDRPGGHSAPRRAEAPIRRCHLCTGTGMAPCGVCNGKGEVVQGRDYHGHVRHAPCMGCYGQKTRRCRHCNGDGWTQV